MTGVSFVVPVHNGGAMIRDTLAAIVAQDDGRPIEIIVVDDHSSDGSAGLLRALAAVWPIRLVDADGRGAAAAINTGVRAARYAIICQVDQDVVVEAGWMARLVGALEDPSVGAAQGYYTSSPGASLCARAMNLDLEQRYSAISGPETDHVCTGNAAYRAEALRRVGLFDESLGYGYDNDVSYRLQAAGYQLRFCRDARSIHRWREGFAGYLRQQYGFGYGRLDLVAKHPRRVGGDAVSPAPMMAHPALMFVALASAAIAGALAAAGAAWEAEAWTAFGIVSVLAIERLAAGVAAAARFRTATPLAFPVLHLCRDVAWAAAIVIWTMRRAVGRSPNPAHSMHPRPHA